MPGGAAQDRGAADGADRRTGECADAPDGYDFDRRRGLVRKDPGADAQGRPATADTVAGGGRGDCAGANALADVRAVGDGGAQAAGDRADILADGDIHQLGNLRAAEWDGGGDVVRHRGVGVERDIFDSGDVHAVQRDRAGVERAAALGAGAFGAMKHREMEI